MSESGTWHKRAREAHHAACHAHTHTQARKKKTHPRRGVALLLRRAPVVPGCRHIRLGRHRNAVWGRLRRRWRVPSLYVMGAAARWDLLLRLVLCMARLQQWHAQRLVFLHIWEARAEQSAGEHANASGRPLACGVDLCCPPAIHTRTGCSMSLNKCYIYRIGTGKTYAIGASVV